MNMPMEAYEVNANSSISLICCQCGIPNISPSLFHTFTGITLTNSFSSLEDTVLSDEIGSAVATSSPISTQSQSTQNKSKHQRKLKALVINFDGLSNKVPELETMIDRHKLDIIIGTESHLNSTMFTSEVSPPGFVTFRRDRPSGKKGDVIIMIKDDIIAAECNIIKTDAELIWIEIHIQGQKPLIIGAFYRPPKSPVTNLEHLATSLADIQTKFKNAVVIVAGDFNLADIDWSDRIVKPYAIEPLKCAALVDLCNEFFLDQMVTEPTRISGVTKNILDLFLTSHPNFIDQCKVVPGVSDHEAVTFMLNFKPKLNKKPARKVFMFGRPA